MPIPSLITDLSQTAGSNYPAGSDSPSVLDDVQRAHAGFIAQLRDGKGQSTPLTLASATTTDIGGQNSQFVEISGTTTITSLGTNYTGVRYLRFTGILTLTHNATSLNINGGASIVTVAGDTAIATPNTALNGWNVFYVRNSAAPGGSTVGATGGGTDQVFYENDNYITTSFTIGQAAQSACTISIASPAVITQNNTLTAGQQVRFTTTGALPTGLSSNAIYYVSATGLTTSSFQVSTASGGASVNTSGTQSGVQTCGKIKHASMLTPVYIATGAVVSVPTGSRLVGL